MNENGQSNVGTDTVPPEDDFSSLWVGFSAVVWTVFVVVFFIVGSESRVSFEFDTWMEALAWFCILYVLPWAILVRALVLAFKKGVAAGRRAKARLFLRTVLWTLGILVLLVLLFFGTCIYLVSKSKW